MYNCNIIMADIYTLQYEGESDSALEHLGNIVDLGIHF